MWDHQRDLCLSPELEGGVRIGETHLDLFSLWMEEMMGNRPSSGAGQGRKIWGCQSPV